MPTEVTFSRRQFLGTSTSTIAAFHIVPSHVLGQNPPSSKLNLAFVGCGGRARANINSLQSENVVALCDVDRRPENKRDPVGAFKKFPRAKGYKDFRVMLDEMEKSIDGVVVSTPDHTHAVITMHAMRMGKHVYVEKPLAHTVGEVRAITEAARKYKVQTQMGNQGHSSERIRQVYDWVNGGFIGDVREVHAWSSRPTGGASFPVNMKRPSDTPPVPAGLDWDLWLGPAQWRPYHPAYVPFKWRGWVDFGTGALGDMGCHILDPCFWALHLDKAETIEVEATSTAYDPEIIKETFPTASIIRFKFPARGKMPPLKLTWSDGRLRPPRPDDMEPQRYFRGEGALLMGERGSILHGSHGASNARIVPETCMKAVQGQLPKKTSIPLSQGHHKDWILACKGGKTASSSFSYGGPLTEMALLGMLALRKQNRLLTYDVKSMRITNDEEANQYINPPYREGWTL